MKKIFYTIICCLLSLPIFGQWSNQSLTFGGALREYRLYVPANYQPSKPASVVVGLHGLGDNMNNFSGIGMNYIADTANILVLVPQALADPLVGTAWNSGAGFGYYPNSNVNDVGFLNAMLDATIANYAVNEQRIYICGFSMGGFMTERMACESNQRIAAIASVSGTIGSGIAPCTPGRAVPVAHFHGTSDGTISYSSNSFGVGADSLVNFWRINNQCNPVPQQNTFPDLVADGLTIDHFLYSNGSPSSDVEFFKVNNGVHNWLFIPQNDIDYTLEIWKFFSKHSLQTTSIANPTNKEVFHIYPNPAAEKWRISFTSTQKGEIQLFDLQGNLILSKNVSGEETEIDIKEHSLAKGIYLLHWKGTYQKVLVE
ncbi:MAG: T9SS type A sorting domain-containing protein [Bacteroidia bacterium]